MSRARAFLKPLALIAIAMPALATVFWAALSYRSDESAREREAEEIALGRQVYAEHCAACHGLHRQGQPRWRERLANGHLPAPPHDASGHTWHHPDRVLFGITKYGPGKFAPPGYESDMPAFQSVLSDEAVWAVLTYIKSRWPESARAFQAQATHKDQER